MLRSREVKRIEKPETSSKILVSTDKKRDKNGFVTIAILWA